MRGWEVLTSPVVHTDDTGWRIGGAAAFLMGFFTPLLAVFQIRWRHRHQEVAATTGIPRRTLTRWLALYRESGLAALARQERADRGGRRGVAPRIREAVEGLALRLPRLPVTAIHRQISSLTRELGEKPPGLKVVYDIIRKLPPDLTMLAHEGAKAHADTFDLVHRQEATRPNAVWQADHCLLDMMALREGGEPAKPWLTVVIDDFSRAIAGYFLSFDAPSSIRTALALRQAIWRWEDPRWRVCGIPEVLYTDNGSDFTSRHLEQVALDLRIRPVFSIPRHPRGRGRIERFFSTVNQLFLSDLPGYAPPGEGVSRSRPTLSLTALDGLFLEFLLVTYHQRPHSATGAAPRDRWENGGFLPQMPASLEQLDLLLLTVARERRVQGDGVRFQGLRYVDLTLAAYVGESVVLRYDPRDMAEVRIFHEGKFLCRAICPELAGETVSLRDILRARGQRRRHLRTTIRNRHETVEALLKLKRGEAASSFEAPAPPPDAPADPPVPRLKRYLHE